jgi:uncharacterized protein HemY
MNQKQFNRWSKVRKKGQFRYVAVHGGLMFVAIVVGQLIGHYIANDSLELNSFIHHNMSNLIFMFIFTPLVMLIIWSIQESSFKKELKK